MAFCNLCGTQVPDGVTVCAGCSGRVGAMPIAGGGLTDGVAGMLAYVTIIPAIIFLVVEPYSRTRFVRFHSFQSLFFTAAVAIIHIGLSMLAVIPLMIFLTMPLHVLVAVASLIVWIVLLVKASQGQMYKLPVIGDMAEKQAG
jgi:uncharacterized membrane protein